MTPVRLVLAVLGLAALALVVSPAMAHGRHAHASQPAIGVVDEPNRLEAATRDLVSTGHVHGAPRVRVAVAVPGRRGRHVLLSRRPLHHPSQPRVCAPADSRTREQEAVRPERPRAAAHPIAVPAAQHVGAVGTRGPPPNS
jgi:hypothetical protein